MIFMHTKKVGTTGRFGNKYGSKVRHAVAKIEASSRAYHVCPQCLRLTLDRQSAGIWKCRKCNITIAGGAYSPVTVASRIMKGEVEAFVEEAAPAAVAPKEIVSTKVEEKKEAAETEEKPAKKRATKAKAKKVKEDKE
ncbi:50S ribosomal protein L37Ae [uncultured archaeon]|nr:50S ribosomal protein L37Ae [uncultured archaeon]